jgi:hypothetical protein
LPEGEIEDDSVMECRVKGLLLFSCTKVLKRNFLKDFFLDFFF